MNNPNSIQVMTPRFENETGLATGVLASGVPWIESTAWRGLRDV
jgi:hypothetical protein